MVTLVRIAWPCDAVEVKDFSRVNAKPVSLFVWVSKLRQVNSVSMGVYSRNRVATAATVTIHERQQLLMER